MMHQHLEYEEILRQAGCRVTRQRVLILDAVCEGHGHTSLADVYARARSYDSSINRSTVYRTLALFVRLNLVYAGVLPEGKTVYEIRTPEPHHHLVCTACGASSEIDPGVMNRFFADLARAHQFTIEARHLVISGVCSSCRADSARDEQAE